MGESNCIFHTKTKKGGKKTLKQLNEGIGPLKKGKLSSTGYSVKKPLKTRHKTLNSLVKKEGALKAFRQLNALVIFNKNSSPTKSKTFKRDRNWIRKKFMKS
jgi:hypothetical protein